MNQYIQMRQNDPETMFLDSFILEKLSEYQEPIRKGTPKGDPIGFSKKKYHTVLLTVAGFKRKEISRFLNIKPGTLRSWMVEDNFINCCSEHFIEFCNFFK